MMGIGLEKLVAVLRDGRKLVGTLRSFDQFGKAKQYVVEPMDQC